MSYTRILSIDGGGIRGIIPATLLIYLEKSLQRYSNCSGARLTDFFDLIAGTSTGGILTCIYLMPDSQAPDQPLFSASEALQFYFEHGHEIFKPTLFQSLRSLRGLCGPKYSAASLEHLLTYYFGDTRLSELLKPCLITSYDISQQSATFFNQLDPAKPHKDDFFIRDLARATSAAPTYFPAAQVTSSKGNTHFFIDGGTFANNPTLCSLVEASKLPNHPYVDQMIILSLGCGSCPPSFKTKSLKKGGAVHWALPLLDIFTSGMTETVDAQMKVLFSNRELSQHYLRLQPDICALGYPDLSMDDADPASLNLLKEIGLCVTDLYKSQLDNFAKLLIECSS